MSWSAARSLRTPRLLPNMASSSATWGCEIGNRLRDHPECRSEVGSGAAPRYEPRDTARIPDAMIRCGKLLGCCSRWSPRRSCGTSGSGTRSERTCKPSRACRDCRDLPGRDAGARLPAARRGLDFEVDRRTGGTDGAAQRRHHCPAGACLRTGCAGRGVKRGCDRSGEPCVLAWPAVHQPRLVPTGNSIDAAWKAGYPALP